MPATAARPLRILAFHGYTSNAFILHKRLGSVRRACRNVAEIHSINGPLLVQPISRSLDAPEGEDEVTEDTPIEEQPRAWWRSTDEGSYRDIDQTWSLLSEEIAKYGQIDGVIGFSQGACLAAIVAAAFEAPDLLPKLKVPAGHPPLKFAVAISGFRSRDPDHQPLFKDAEKGIKTPVLSILGRADQIVDEERSMTLVHACQNRRVEWHAGGHVVPSQANWRNFLRDFIGTFVNPAEQPNEDWRTVEGPSARTSSNEDDDNGGGSGAASGTAAPTTHQSSSATKPSL
ncbi:unnamed protein product [Parajaminaea phylloscopi]